MAIDDNAATAPVTAAGAERLDTRSYAALRQPASRTYLICAALAMTADSIEHVVSYWMIFNKFHSPALAGFAVIAIATSGPAYAGMEALLARLDRDSASLLVMTDVGGYVGPGEVVRVPAVPEWLSPAVAIVPGQMFAYHLALARGLDIEHPRNISKVTLTR